MKPHKSHEDFPEIYYAGVAAHFWLGASWQQRHPYLAFQICPCPRANGYLQTPSNSRCECTTHHHHLQCRCLWIGENRRIVWYCLCFADCSSAQSLTQDVVRQPVQRNLASHPARLIQRFAEETESKCHIQSESLNYLVEPGSSIFRLGYCFSFSAANFPLGGRA